MTIKIIATLPAESDYNLGHFSIDKSRKTAVLIRQSMKNADKDHYESRLLQENLVPIAKKLREEDDETNILVFDEGAGISGTKGYDEREKLSALYLAIANNVVGSLLVARPDRLFRDKHFLNVGMFTDLAERKRLILIVPGRRIYDFTKYSDLQVFQKDMQDAYGYIATHVKYMNDARYQKMLRGLFGGGNLPAPYVIDKNAWKEEQVPIIYKPWLEPALDLFAKFKECDFSVGRLGRYMESLPYLFPAPSYEDTQHYMFKTLMRLVPGGYTFSDISSVRYFLSNLTLGGYAKVGKDEEGNVLLLPNAFEAAIPFDLLDASYAVITGQHIDGTPFEGSSNKRRYMRSNPQGPRAILHGLLTSEQGHITTCHREYGGEYECYEGLKQDGYELKLRSGIISAKRHWSLPNRELDRIVLDRLFAFAHHDPDMSERLRSTFEKQKTQEISEAQLLDGQIQQTKNRIDRLDFLLTSVDIPLDVETAKKYAKDLAELRPKLDRLIKKRQAQTDVDPEKTITDFYFVIAHLPTEFEKRDSEIQKQIMGRLVKEISITSLSPHLFRLYVVWQDGIAMKPDVALIWRGKGLQLEQWSDEEDKCLREIYPEGSQLEIMYQFPKRSWGRIKQHASELGILRRVKARVNPYHPTMSYEDLSVAMKYTENGEDATYISQKVDEMSRETVRGQMRAYWPLPLDIISLYDFIRNEGDRSG